MTVRTLTIAVFSALLISSCGSSEPGGASTADGGRTTAATPLQALLECDPARDAAAASGMRLAAEYGNGKFYLPNEPIEAFGMPVAGLLIYNERYWFGQPMGANINVSTDAPPGVYSVTFVDVPGRDASRVLASWAAAHGYSEIGSAANEDGESSAVTWVESSAIQSVSPDAMPADVVDLVRRGGPGAIVPISVFLKGGADQDVAAHTLWVEATETGEVSAIHCPSHNIAGLF